MNPQEVADHQTDLILKDAEIASLKAQLDAERVLTHHWQRIAVEQSAALERYIDLHAKTPE